jgi:hypothetical protein
MIHLVLKWCEERGDYSEVQRHLSVVNEEESEKRTDSLVRENASLDRVLRELQDRIVGLRQGHPLVFDVPVSSYFSAYEVDV